jgi:hypothetical protein
VRLERYLVAGAALAMLAGGGASVAMADAGDPPVVPMIDGGTTVASAPWAVQVNAAGGFCSGTIISARWVLTAAHCLEDSSDPDDYSVLVGNVNRGSGTAATVVAMKTRFDVAVRQLGRGVTTTYAKLGAGDPPVGASVDVYGWGVTCEGCGLSPVLKTANMRLQSVSANSDGSRDLILKQVNGFPLGGDSGGPAFYNGTVVGELCCGNSDNAGNGTESYSSIAGSLSWITANTGVTRGDGGGTPPPVNLALGRTTKASAPCATAETGAKAVNGSVTGGSTDKWCSAAGATKRIEVDLGVGRALRAIVVKHAGAGGEPAALNTRSFVLEASTGGGIWTTVATVTGNTAAVTTAPVSVTARWIRFSTTDPIARVYEFEAYA